MDGTRGIRLRAIASVCAGRDLQESSKECRGDAQKPISQKCGIENSRTHAFLRTRYGRRRDELRILTVISTRHFKKLKPKPGMGQAIQLV